MKKYITTLTILTFCALLFGCVATVITQSPQTPSEAYATEKAATPDVTIYQIASFLMDKKEHYPISDEFIERYQQTGGGYIEFAKQLGLTVDRAQHEPNQKWHFFDSWLMESFKDGTITWEDSARSRVYSKLLCPELLLWIYEACGVDPVKVRAAATVAEQGKVAGTGVSTIAKNMRACVSWDDFNIDVTKKMAKSATLPETFTVELGAADAVLTAVPDPVDTTDVATWKVVEGDCITVTPVGHSATIHATKTGVAKIHVTYNKYAAAECAVTVKEPDVTKIVGVPSAIDLDVGGSTTFAPTLNKGTGTFSCQVADSSVASLLNGSLSANALGSTQITVTCNEDPTLQKIVAVEVFDHGSTTPLSVANALEVVAKVCTVPGDVTTGQLWVTGKALTSADANGNFVLCDATDTTKRIVVSASTLATGVENVSQNDLVVVRGLVEMDETLQFAQATVLSNVCGNSVVTLGDHENATVTVGGTTFAGAMTAANGSAFTFEVVPATGFVVTSVTVNGQTITSANTAYSFTVTGNAEIVVTAIDPSKTLVLAYNIEYDLNGGKQSKALNSAEEILATFVAAGNGESIILSVAASDKIYGGGYGTGTNAWTANDMLKFGTTSVNGSLTLELSVAVVGVKITGYIHAANCKVQAGDSASTDWTDETNDNKTTTVTCTNMTIASKDTVESGEATTFEISFASTTSLTIANTNKKPLYVTAIEFILAD